MSPGLFWIVVLIVSAYGILFGVALLLSRRRSPSRRAFQRLNGLLYGASFFPSLVILARSAPSPPALVLEVFLLYVLSVLLLLPSLYLVTSRRTPLGPFGPFAAVALGARLTMAVPFFLSMGLYTLLTGTLHVAGFPAEMALAVGIVLLVSAAVPHILAHTLGRTDRLLTAAARKLAREAGVRPPTVVLLPTRAAAIQNAFVMGPFNRYVFVTDDLYARTGPDLTLATIAHEMGHRGRRHIPLLLLFLPLWALLNHYAWQDSLPVAALGLLSLLALMRRGEYDADRFGALLVGRDAMVRDLRSLEALGGDPPEPRRPRPLSVFRTHPTIEDRVRRLMADGTGERPRDGQAATGFEEACPKAGSPGRKGDGCSPPPEGRAGGPGEEPPPSAGRRERPRPGRSR